MKTFAARCILFDLDGTLLDTAPDLAWALNEVRRRRGADALPFDTIRPHVSHGSLALTRLGCPADEASQEFQAFRDELLEVYGENVARESTLFAGMGEVLHTLARDSVAWGIVTNKPEWLTHPLLQSIALEPQPHVVISGDTAGHAKPHPAPLIMAAEQVAIAPEFCVYVGDAQRDIEAGKAAGMSTVVALYGYLQAEDEPHQWGADAAISTPQELLNMLG